MQSNWKFCYQISLDDYHIVAVHPSTFGKGGYLPAGTLNYTRFGRHSAFFAEQNAESLATMARRMNEPGYVPTGYRIFQIFPNLAISHSSAPGPFGTVFQTVAVFQYVPVAHDRSHLRAWLQRSPYQAPPTGAKQRLLMTAQPIFDHLRRRMATKILNEDHEVCETLQRHVEGMGAIPLLGAPERRVGWFEEVYAAAVGTDWLAGEKPHGEARTASVDA